MRNQIDGHVTFLAATWVPGADEIPRDMRNDANTGITAWNTE